MKKIVLRSLSVCMTLVLLLSIASFPSFAANDTDYCFEQGLEDSLGSTLTTKLTIEHYGQTFEFGFVDSTFKTQKTVPTTDYIYLDSELHVEYVRHGTGRIAENEIYTRTIGYAIGNQTYKSSVSYYSFMPGEVVQAVNVLGQLSETNGQLNGNVGSIYHSLVTDVYYRVSFSKTLAVIFRDGLDYLK